MDIKLTEEQSEFVKKYTSLYERLSTIELQISNLKNEAEILLKELEDLRENEKKLFENKP